MDWGPKKRLFWRVECGKEEGPGEGRRVKRNKTSIVQHQLCFETKALTGFVCLCGVERGRRGEGVVVVTLLSGSHYSESQMVACASCVLRQRQIPLPSECEAPTNESLHNDAERLDPSHPKEICVCDWWRHSWCCPGGYNRDCFCDGVQSLCGKEVAHPGMSKWLCRFWWTVNDIFYDTELVIQLFIT